MNAFLWLKALHVIAIISWMAGLLYLVRLYIYHEMETVTACKERFGVMERRLLFYITNPAAVVAWITGLSMLAWGHEYLLQQPWLHVKLGFVVLLTAFHFWCIPTRKRLLEGKSVPSSRTLRFLNEVPTLLMIGIVIMVIVRPWGR